MKIHERLWNEQSYVPTEAEVVQAERERDDVVRDYNHGRISLAEMVRGVFAPWTARQRRTNTSAT